MAISLIAYAKADIRASKSALEADLHFSVRIDSVEKALRLAENWLREIQA